jgi:hypothetical protein
MNQEPGGESPLQPALPLSEALLHDIREEFPSFRIQEKRNSPLSWLIDKLLILLTFGGQRSYLTTYYTVLGSTLFVPDGWAELPDVDRVILLRHERIHLRQRRRLTLPGMAFLYLIPFFPLGLAYGRARLEWEAYRETILATFELKGIAEARALRPQIVRRFVAADYGFMWPFPSTIDRWYGRVIAELEGVEPLKGTRVGKSE